MEFEQLQRAIEAILFAAGERMEISRLSEVLEVDPDEIEKAADAMADEFAFQRRGIRILKLEKGYQMVSSGEMADFVTKALETRKPPKLSASQLETLTIIAYYQPATKAMVEQIRGAVQVWDNDRLSHMMDTSDEWIRGRTGIRQRHIANRGETVAYMAARAAGEALVDAGMRPA